MESPDAELQSHTSTAIAVQAIPPLARIPSPCLPQTSSHQHWLHQRGFFKCCRSRCPCCKYTVKTEYIVVAISHERRYVRQFIYCDSIYVVNYVRCVDCNVGYVGCTTRKLKTRILEHLHDAGNTEARNPSDVSKHFSVCHSGNLNSLRVCGIERVNRPRRGGD